MSVVRRNVLPLYAALAVALVIRVLVVIAQPERLTQDIDSYLAIGRQLVSGHGYSLPESGQPTAFRPPLYPLLVAAVMRARGGGLALGLVQALLGTATVGLTWWLGRRLQLGAASSVAALLVAVDPLLVQYTALPMTEILSAFLVTLLLLLLAGPREGESSRLRRFLIGAALGLNILCRPTLWAFAMLAAGWWMVKHWKPGTTSPGSPLSTGGGARRTIGVSSRVCQSWPVLVGLALTVAPWGIRNAIVLGRPILTTTHGGYTLLLANNPVFYREVVAQPWGTTWSGESLSAWQQSLHDAMQSEGIRGEVESDRWMGHRARRSIADQPAMFARSVWQRFLRFWNIAPLDAGTESLRSLWIRACRGIGAERWIERADVFIETIRWAVAAFYSAILAAFAAGLLRLRREEWPRWMPLMLMIAAFTAVHLLYWTNTRMRAPVMPAIALFAARGIARRPSMSGGSPARRDASGDYPMP